MTFYLPKADMWGLICNHMKAEKFVVALSESFKLFFPVFY